MERDRILLTKKIAIVTGAGSGIGKGIARGFADFGAKLALVEVRAAVRPDRFQGGIPR